MTPRQGGYLVAAPLADHLRRHPELHVAVRSGGTSELLALLNAGEIDCAFVEGFSTRMRMRDVFRTERLVCVCAADHEFAARPVRVEDLFDERLIVREPGSGTRAVLEHALAAQNQRWTASRRPAWWRALTSSRSSWARSGNFVSVRGGCGARAGRRHAANTSIWRARHLHDIAFIRLKNSVFERVPRTCSPIS